MRRAPPTRPVPEEAALAAMWARRRCRCGAPAAVVTVGADAVRVVGILLGKARPDRNRCLRHMLQVRRAA